MERRFMAKSLVIVESPAKAKTIGRYLGDNYVLRSSVGHIRDLPSGTLGVNVNNNFKPLYVNMPGKEKIVRDLKTQAEKADTVLLATDPDREGEAIARHLAHILDLDPNEDIRISFNEITADSVKKAVEEPRPIDLDLVNAQQARRILDRLVGYELSPLLWQKIRKGLSAGRVQSVATRLIVLREREIEAFVPEEYWLLSAYLRREAKEKEFFSRYHGEMEDGKVKAHRPGSREEVTELIKDIKSHDFIVEEVKKGTRQRRPYAPYTTSTLQQDASRVLGFTAKRTMRAAQQLYEGVELGASGQTSLVTYIRTDSVRVSQASVDSARDYIKTKHGAEYVPDKAPFYKNKKAAQDAHEAIRPSHFDKAPEAVEDYLTRDQFKLYELIWNRFISSQMKPAKYATLRVDILSGTHLFRSNGENLLFPGWLLQTGALDLPSKAKEDADDVVTMDMPELKKGMKVLLDRLEPEQKFTQPPGRYTEASLIKELENLGIGRPSTYAPTISTIQDRQYVEREGRTLFPTDLGILVNDMLEDNFSNIVDTDFTAKMEERLDDVEEGKEDWVKVLSDFYGPFHEQIETAKTSIEKIEIPDEPTGRKCPECDEGELVIRMGRYGKFIACDRYPECKYTETIFEEAPAKCPLCASQVVYRKSKRGRVFYTCDKSNDKDCKFIDWNLPLDGKNCPECGSYMVERNYRGQKSEMCSNKECPTRKKTKKNATKSKSKSEKAKSVTATSKKKSSSKKDSSEDEE
ncbi:MAG: type I DNA topoisomerase [Eubacteriales bacterium]|nr:type I DNA topoisomerase [Eubacteriales bacterium]MDD4540585.1 type I DNA topoisomerase [Eubacteriales bacterium]